MDPCDAVVAYAVDVESWNRGIVEAVARALRARSGNDVKCMRGADATMLLQIAGDTFRLPLDFPVTKVMDRSSRSS